MAITDHRIKHLEFIQLAINRMAANSFLLKGWSVALVGGLLAAAIKENDWRYVAVGVVAVLFFWLLDGFYLFSERCFIKLFNHVRTSDADMRFSMDPKPYRANLSWHGCVASKTLLVFYGGLTVASLCASLLIRSCC